MSTLELSRQAIRGEADAMAQLIRSLADDLYECRSSDLERTHSELERTLRESSDNTHRRRELKALWELTHVFLSKVPVSLQPCLELPSDSAEKAILHLIQSDEALTLEEICQFSSLEEGAVQEALGKLQAMGLVVPLVGDARQLTRDGREVKRWICSRDAAGKTRKLEADGPPELPAPARPRDKVKRATSAMETIDAARRLVSAFDKNLRAKLRLASVHLRQTVNEAEALHREAAHKQSLLRIAGSELRVLRQDEVQELERKVPRDTEIWVIGVMPPNGEAFFDVVAGNIMRDRGQYFYVCPEADFRDLWGRLAKKCEDKDRIRRRLACITNAPELLRLDTARIHVFPDGKIQLMRVYWLGIEKSEPFYLMGSTLTDFPYLQVLRSYRQAARDRIQSSGLPAVDFQQLEPKARRARSSAR